MNKAKFLTVPAAAVAAGAGAGAADAAVLITQDFNYTLVNDGDSFAVNIGGNSVAQYTYFQDGKAYLDQADGFSGTVNGLGAPTPGLAFETYDPSVKTSSVGEGYYHLKFKLNGDTTYGYASVSNGGYTLDSVTYRISAVPEPAAWALMILGFGAAGAALRRRRQPSAPASA